MSAFRVVATHCHLTKPDVYTVSHESFDTEAEAVAWMNGGSGESFAQACTIDTNGCDPQLVDYWLDEVEVRGQDDIDALPEKPGVQVPIDDEDAEMEAGGWTDPDMEPDDEPEWHTYATVLQFSARSDEHAREIAAKFKELIEAWHEFIERDLPEDEQITMQPQGYVIEAAHVVDADDWAESLGQEDVCLECGESGGTNRSRTGCGSRVCPSCIEAKRLPHYRIEEALI